MSQKAGEGYNGEREGEKDIPPMALSHILQRLKLPARHATGTNIPHLPGLDHIIQRLHDLLRWRLPIQPMDLQHINVRPQSRNALVHSVQDVFPRQPDLVHHRPVILRHLVDPRLRTRRVDAEMAFAEDDELLARNGVFPDSGADDLLGAPVGVYVRGVPGVETDFVCMFEEGQGGFFVQHPFLPVP